MCNLYSITRSQEAMRRLFRAKRNLAGNFPGLQAVFPDVIAPVVRTARDGEREFSMMRWGFPAPPNLGKVPVTPMRHFWPWALFAIAVLLAIFFLVDSYYYRREDVPCLCVGCLAVLA